MLDRKPTSNPSFRARDLAISIDSSLETCQQFEWTKKVTQDKRFVFGCMERQT
jgi:hypothetical protein